MNGSQIIYFLFCWSIVWILDQTSNPRQYWYKKCRKISVNLTFVSVNFIAQNYNSERVRMHLITSQNCWLLGPWAPRAPPRPLAAMARFFRNIFRGNPRLTLTCLEWRDDSANDTSGIGKTETSVGRWQHAFLLDYFSGNRRENTLFHTLFSIFWYFILALRDTLLSKIEVAALVVSQMSDNWAVPSLKMQRLMCFHQTKHNHRWRPDSVDAT